MSGQGAAGEPLVSTTFGIAGSPSGQTQQRAFEIQFNLGMTLSAPKGHGPETGTALARALSLGRQLGESGQLGDSHQLAQVLYELSFHAMMRGEMAQAQAYGEECLRLKAIR